MILHFVFVWCTTLAYFSVFMQFVHIRTYIHTCRAYININKCDSFCVVIYSTKFSESLTLAASGRRQNAPNSFCAGAPDPAGKAHDAPSDALVGWGGGVGLWDTPSPYSSPRRFRSLVCLNLFFVPARLFVQSRRRAGLQNVDLAVGSSSALIAVVFFIRLPPNGDIPRVL